MSALQPVADAVDLSIAVVNYNASVWIDGLLKSLAAEEFTVDGRPGTMEIILVDNASPAEDGGHLESLAQGPVRLIRNTENLGYALANNQAFHVARGRFHLVANPDVFVEKGCLQALLDALLQCDQAAIVGPMASMDPDGRVLLPPNELPDPWIESIVCIGRHADAVARYHCRRRAREAYRYWTATEPLEVRMLSGGFFMGRRETFEEHGLFDPGYPLYYEDTDLFRRCLSLGLRQYHVPSARIVHLYSKSAIPRMKAAMYRNRLGAARYFERWFGLPGLRTLHAVRARAEARSDDSRAPFPLRDLGILQDAPSIALPPVKGCYLEMAGNPKFSLAVALFPDTEGSFQLPAMFWEGLAPIRYWGRIVAPESGENLDAWSLVKCPKA